jgi:hypothetical protein
MISMTIQAVVFDIGGVLEITPDLGVTAAWESRLGLDDSQACVEGARQAGIGAVLYRDNAQAIGDIEALLAW